MLCLDDCIGMKQTTDNNDETDGGYEVGIVASATDTTSPTSQSSPRSNEDVEARGRVTFGQTSEKDNLIEGNNIKPSSRKFGRISIAKRESVIKNEPLQENIFSLIFVAKSYSMAFVMSVTVAITQILMLFFALLDLVDVNSSENPLRIPNDVSPPVRATGVVCLLLSVAQFWDFMEAVEKLQQGVPPRTEETSEDATCLKFYLAYILQFCLGSIFEVAVFVLVVSSSTVLDMFLNFAGLEFVTLIDDIMFLLAKRGYFTTAVKKACDTVSQNMVPRLRGGRVVRRVILLLIIIILMTMYGVLAAKQQSSAFDCEKIQVQFGDGFITLLPVFSGFYEIARDDPRQAGRPVYWDEDRRAAFRYCFDGDNGFFSFASDGYWVFNYISDDATRIEDMCNDYISRSPYTRGFDILEHPPSSWMVKRRKEDTIEYPVDYFNLRCADCDESTCNGRCEGDTCVCRPGSFGSGCQFTDSVCEVTNYDHRTRKFSGANMNISSEFYLLRNSAGDPAFAFERPIYMFPYYLPNATKTFDNLEKADLLMNLGRRYLMISIWLRGFRNSNLERVDKVNSTEELADYLESVHPYFDWIDKKYVKNEKGIPVFRPSFVSDPIDIGTASDNISPLGLSWARIEESPILSENAYDIYLSGAAVDTVLICAQCNENSPSGCKGRGTCRNSMCSCNPGFVGPTCEVDCFDTFLEPYCQDVPDCVKDLTCTAAELVSGAPTVDFYVYPTAAPSRVPKGNGNGRPTNESPTPNEDTKKPSPNGNNKPTPNADNTDTPPEDGGFSSSPTPDGGAGDNTDTLLDDSAAPSTAPIRQNGNGNGNNRPT